MIILYSVLSGGRCRSCSFWGCKKFKTNNDWNPMFSFPGPGMPDSSLETRCHVRIERSCNPDLAKMTPFEVSRSRKPICGDHFLKEQFSNESKKKLIRDQIPQLNVLHGTPLDTCHSGVERDVPVVIDSRQASPSILSEVTEMLDRNPQRQQFNNGNRWTNSKTTPRFCERVTLAECAIRKQDMAPRKRRHLKVAKKNHIEKKFYLLGPCWCV